MRQHTVEIGDSQGHAFKMLIWTPSAWTKLKFWNSSDRNVDGDWRAIEKGYIRFNSGDAIRRYNGDGETGADLYLYVPDEKDKSNAGIILSKYDDWEGTNDQGAGELVLRATPLGITPDTRPTDVVACGLEGRCARRVSNFTLSLTSSHPHRCLMLWKGAQKDLPDNPFVPLRYLAVN